MNVAVHAAGSASPPLSRAQRVFGSAWFWVMFTLVGFAVWMSGVLYKDLPKPPGVYGQVPSFSLTDQAGEPFGSADLLGRPWVLSWACAACAPEERPSFAGMKELAFNLRKTKEQLLFVTLSTRPEDVQEARLALAKAEHVRPNRWKLLHDPGELTAALEAPMQAAAPGVAHAEKLVLVDHLLQVRGVFDPTEEGQAALTRHLTHIFNFEMKVTKPFGTIGI